MEEQSVINAVKSEILYGADNIVKRTIQDFHTIKERLDNCIDSTSPYVFFKAPIVWKELVGLRNRGVKLRFITEITKDNINYSKELSTVAELRHLDRVKGNFGIADGRDYAGSASVKEGEPPTELIRSNVKTFVEQQQYFFETLWNKAIQAEQRIREIEEGIMPIRTRIIENQDEIIKEIKHKNNSASKLSVCSTFGGMQMSYNFLFDSFEKVIDKHRKGESEGIRWIISIDKESIPLVKTFIKAGIRVRHLKNMLPMSFGVSDKEVSITIEKMEGGKMSQSILISNDPLYTVHFNSVFEGSWKTGIDAKERIALIEEGADLADIEVIPSAARAREIYLEALKKAQRNIMIVFPTTNAFLRQHKMGVVQLAKEAAEQRNVRIKILMPRHESTKQLVRRLTERTYSIYNNINLRYIKQTRLNTHVTILIVDEKVSLVMEIRDDSKGTFDEAIGLSIYSDSRAGVLSYVSIFENLWEQTELYDQIKQSSIQLEQANEQLIAHHKMQKEFINIAAHELRTPIQPILGLADILRSKETDGAQEAEYLDVIIRNAKRLQRLTEEILDISRIESKSLDLKKESFNLSEMILNAVADSNNQVAKEHKDTNLKLDFDSKEDIFIEADKSRINQVISNLLSNAIKFTNKGTISITAIAVPNKNEIVVSINDTGRGIDSEMLPRLFTKFATKSTSGTGLGLFISKSIVDAHGGKIWGKNNYPEGKGATFGFSVPLHNQKCSG